MADVQPFRALHFDPAVAGDFGDLVAPPYDVIDAEHRARLVGRSPRNVVNIDLPEAEGDIYEHAAEILDRWRGEGAVVRDDEPALWALRQDYTGPDGRSLTRQGFFARIRVEDYGPGPTPAPAAVGCPPRGSSPESRSRTTAPGGSPHQSGPTPAPRRTACGSRGRRAPTCPRSSCCIPAGRCSRAAASPSPTSPTTT